MRDLWRWYVYELADSRTGEVFYVGKGCGDRMHAHEAEAAKGVRSRKTARINEIKAAKAEVVKRQMAFFCDEQAAYDHETDRIELLGLENLTNVLPGGQKAWVRRRAERDSRRKKTYSATELVLKEASRIAYWLIHTNGGQRKACAVFSGGDDRITKLRNDLAEVVWTKLVPDMWQKAIADPADWPRVKAAFRPYGIDLQFPSA